MSNQTVVERLGRAVASHNLKQSDIRLVDVDFLTALGQVGARQPLLTTIMRLDLTLDVNDFKDALADTGKLVLAEAKKRRWVVTNRKANVIALRALSHYISPACKTCLGRKFVGMAEGGGMQGTPTPCHACASTGVAPIRGEFAQEVKAIVAVLQSKRATAAQKVRSKIRISAEVE